MEKDLRLYDESLRRKFAGMPQVGLRHGNFLSFLLPRRGYKVFANIPFDQTTAIVQKLTASVTGLVRILGSERRLTRQQGKLE